MMDHVSYWTEDAFDGIARVLDCARISGVQLDALTAKPEGAGHRVTLRLGGTPCNRAFADRIARLPMILDLSCPPAIASHPVKEAAR